MTVPSTLIAQTADRVADILTQIESETTKFAAESGIRCRKDCGQCCLGPNVEARVIELLPMAQKLFELGCANETYQLASTATSSVCILYRPNPEDPTLGKCAQYANRPSVCRLFGFAAIRSKNGKRELAACHWHKRLQPDAVSAAQEKIDQGGDVPMFPDYGMRLGALTTADSLVEMRPINQALMRAIEKVALAFRE